jgi:AraC-like DNA-binding protein
MLIYRPSDEQILALVERLGLPVSLYHGLVSYFERLPQLKSQEVFDTICFSVADTVFSGRDQYKVRVIHNSAEPDALQQMIARNDPIQEESQEERFRNLEKRYALENSLLSAVETGDVNAALSSFYRFVRFSSGLARMPDRLRDKKDLVITLNTLLRKAAERAGVHPYYIDAFSNSRVAKLEQCSNTIQVDSFGRDQVTGYCELIQQYALNPYSKPIRDAIFLIQSDLSADLSLAAIAERLNLTHSYLSNLFCKEVGQTLSAFVLGKRIRRAQHLLTTTPLSIQDIAWEVGIPDANYFTRLFKRETGETPRKYRETNHV